MKNVPSLLYVGDGWLAPQLWLVSETYVLCARALVEMECIEDIVAILSKLNLDDIEKTLSEPYHTERELKDSLLSKRFFNKSSNAS